MNNITLKAADDCVDIKAFLWTNQGDLTSLPSTMLVFLVLYVLIITLGVLGNGLVILSVIRHKSLQSVRNMFIVSLSCSDIVASLVSGSVTPISAFTKIWLFGETLCKFVPLIQGSSLCFSTLTLTAISIDRFILIIYPTKRSIQTKHALRMIAVNCFIAICISLPMVFKQKLVDYADFCGQFCTEDWKEDTFARSAYGTMVFILQFVVPFVIITFCYLMISIRLGQGMLVKDRSDHQQLNQQQSEQRKTALKRRLRTNRMLIAMVAVFLCCWTPAVLFNFLRDYQWLPQLVAQQEYLFGVITHCISMSSTVWNPLLYTMLNEQFRLAFAEFFRCCRKSKPKSGRYKSANGSNESKTINTRLNMAKGSTVNGFVFDFKGKRPQLVRNEEADKWSPEKHARNDEIGQRWMSGSDSKEKIIENEERPEKVMNKDDKIQKTGCRNDSRPMSGFGDDEVQKAGYNKTDDQVYPYCSTNQGHTINNNINQNSLLNNGKDLQSTIMNNIAPQKSLSNYNTLQNASESKQDAEIWPNTSLAHPFSTATTTNAIPQSYTMPQSTVPNRYSTSPNRPPARTFSALRNSMRTKAAKPEPAKYSTNIVQDSWPGTVDLICHSETKIESKDGGQVGGDNDKVDGNGMKVDRNEEKPNMNADIYVGEKREKICLPQLGPASHWGLLENEEPIQLEEGDSQI
ncbi:unnamed protein product [Bursaphelenchus okinawaensis]|uniref:G-protein coupled receptors family 1 profile domain-containing protein n=1 Tax=Bursaphelenchus okinawaensis TaxID=465554 RepID=A0A811LL11_9BILA|nr:unnamed protein product [Bursaphelenchus okinawaensis]CAG9124379.1 unnamed protein product [Bursaphelenchus okinawaensis]